MTITSEGLRIELMESASGTFFDSGSPKLNADGRDVLITLAHELGKLPEQDFPRRSHQFQALRHRGEL